MQPDNAGSVTQRGDIAHSVTRGAFYLALEKAAALFSGTLFFVVMLRLLGPTKYGIMTLALSIIGVATLGTGNIEMFMERFAADYHARGMMLTLKRAQRYSLLMKLALGIPAALVVILISPTLARQFNAPDLAVLLPLLAVMVAGDGFATTGRATLYGLQQFKKLALMSVMFHAAKCLMVVVLWFGHQGLVGLSVGLSAITVTLGIAQSAVPIWMLRRARDRWDGRGEAPPTDRELLKSMRTYATPLLGARITFISGQNLGKILLGKLFEPALLGYFSFAFQTIERFVELVYILPSSLLPAFTRLVAHEDWDRLRRVFDDSHRLIQVASCAVSLALFIFAREITLLIGSPLFEPAVPVLRVLALVPIARTAQLPLAMLFQAMRRPGTVLALDLLKFGVEFGSYVVLIPWLGLVGAGVANLGSVIISYVVSLIVLARAFPAGAAERARTVIGSMMLFAPLMAAGVMLGRAGTESWTFALRVMLLAVAIPGVFALGLVTPLDLERLAAIPLRTDWMRRTRDAAVNIAGRVASLVAPGGAA